jgi:hypothetical protein
MKSPVKVDLSSAVVAYRPAAGEERSVPVRAVQAKALFDSYPWRTFRSYEKQKHYSGTYWSSTLADHVIYESRLELANLVIADFDTGVKRIAAQPFMLTATVNDRTRAHILDYLWGTDEQPIVVDVVRRERLSLDAVQLLCAWTRVIIESCGWTYQVVNEPDPTYMANVRFLAGYRRGWLVNQDVLVELRARKEQMHGRSIAEVEASLPGYTKPIVRPALLNMLWCRELAADLTQPLRPVTVLEVST